MLPGVKGKEKTRPMFRPGFNSRRRIERRSVRSVADLDAAEAPAVTIPEALANHAAGRGRVFVIHRTAIGRAAGGDGSADERAADQSAYHGCPDAALCACGCRGERTSDRCDRDEGSKCLLHV